MTVFNHISLIFFVTAGKRIPHVERLHTEKQHFYAKKTNAKLNIRQLAHCQRPHRAGHMMHFLFQHSDYRNM